MASESNMTGEDFYRNVGRGIALIIVNRNFLMSSLPERKGSPRDRHLLVDLFTKLGFDVRVFEDLTKEDILREAQKVSGDNEALERCDCLVVAVSSHGKSKEVMCVEQDVPGYILYDQIDMLCGIDEPFEIRDLTRLFNNRWCPQLRDKPKIFFLQGCRGERFTGKVQTRVTSTGQDTHPIRPSDMDTTDVLVFQGSQGTSHAGPRLGSSGWDPLEGMNPPSTSLSETEAEGEGGLVVMGSVATGREIPSASGSQTTAVAPPADTDEPLEKLVSHRSDIYVDYLLMSGTPPGHHAFHTSEGSPLFTYLHEVLLEHHGKDDLLTMLNRVNKQVTRFYESYTDRPESNERHIVTHIEHMLKKKIMLSTPK